MDAPPIKKPSILSILIKFFIFFGLTEPPYKTLDFENFFDLFKVSLINLIFFIKLFSVGIIPVPMDQTGSYAIITLFNLFKFFKPSSNCFFKTNLVLFFFLSINFSPIQKITFNFLLSADFIFKLIFLLSFSSLVSECPIITNLRS